MAVGNSPLRKGQSVTFASDTDRVHAHLESSSSQHNSSSNDGNALAPSGDDDLRKPFVSTSSNDSGRDSDDFDASATSDHQVPISAAAERRSNAVMNNPLNAEDIQAVKDVAIQLQTSSRWFKLARCATTTKYSILLIVLECFLLTLPPFQRFSFFNFPSSS
jgi:hypothetical protein